MSCINKNTDEPPLVVATSNAEFLKSLRQSWDRPYTESAFLKDIPRLVKRVQVQTRDGALHGPAAEDTSKVEAIVALVELISRELCVCVEEKEEKEETLSAVRDIRSSLDRYGVLALCWNVHIYACM